MPFIILGIVALVLVVNGYQVFAGVCALSFDMLYSFLPSVIWLVLAFILFLIIGKKSNAHHAHQKKLISPIERKRDEERKKLECEIERKRRARIESIESTYRSEKKEKEAKCERLHAEFEAVSVFRAEPNNSTYLSRLIELMEDGYADTIAAAINIAHARSKELLAEFERKERERMLREDMERKTNELIDIARRDAEARREHEKEVRKEIDRIRRGE